MPPGTNQEPNFQRWTLEVEGHQHRVDVELGLISRTISWSVDGVVVASKKTHDSGEHLVPDPELGPEVAALGEVGAIKVRFTTMGKGRRATWFEPSLPTEDDDHPLSAEANAILGVGGLDFDPEPGSPAAAYEESVRLHPTRFAILHTLGGVAKVGVPILLALLAFQLPWPDWNINLPWPNLPWPNLPWPQIPWPQIPWPDLSLPGWLAWILDHLKYVLPILLAVMYARREIGRRREQDAKKAELADGLNSQG